MLQDILQKLLKKVNKKGIKYYFNLYKIIILLYRESDALIEKAVLQFHKR